VCQLTGAKANNGYVGARPRLGCVLLELAPCVLRL
jgi:hypothetical protein